MCAARRIGRGRGSRKPFIARSWWSTGQHPSIYFIVRHTKMCPSHAGIRCAASVLGSWCRDGGQWRWRGTKFAQDVAASPLIKPIKLKAPGVLAFERQAGNCRFYSQVEGIASQQQACGWCCGRRAAQVDCALQMHSCPEQAHSYRVLFV